MNPITTVLTVTDRIDYLESQIESIENQTVKSDILIHWNTKEKYTLNYPALIYTNQHKSAPLYSRFFNSLTLQTPYTFICDDDILPGNEYLEKCINFSKLKNDKACIVSYGMIFKEGEVEYKVEKRLHHGIYLSEPRLVNMGGQGYFFPTNLLQKYNETETYATLSGEDIHLGYVCWKHCVPVYVLDKDKNNKESWQDKSEGKRGLDNAAQWRYASHIPIRNNLIKIYTNLGWEFKLHKSTI